MDPGESHRKIYRPEAQLSIFDRRMCSQAFINTNGIVGVNFFLVTVVDDLRGLDVGMGVVKVDSCVWVDSTHSPNRFRSKQDVIGRDDLEQ